ncbi:DUF922 domain-containing protein [Brevundimonas sp.]|uniref:DUF922 domain-containing protein n=1 Tax=Brevundimonas sp. TaxID=1871086 RepID=UPI0035B2ED4B
MAEALFLALLLQAFAGDVEFPGIEIQTYTIDDAATSSLREAMRSARLHTADGGRAVVRTDWRYDWRWARSRDGACVAESARTEAKVVMTVPVISLTTSFDDRELERFATFVDGLMDYERGRLALIDQGRERSDSAMRGASNCAEMEAAARAVHLDTVRRIAEYETQNTAARDRLVF